MSLCVEPAMAALAPCPVPSRVWLQCRQIPADHPAVLSLPVTQREHLPSTTPPTQAAWRRWGTQRITSWRGHCTLGPLPHSRRDPRDNGSPWSPSGMCERGPPGWQHAALLVWGPHSPPAEE
eukprot:659515-Rhodomonas_salina.1